MSNSIQPDMNNPLSQVNPMVLYDGSCPVCSREIAHYRKRKNAELITWIDASKQQTQLNTLGVSQEEAMAIFHVRDTGGNWQRGVDGFIYLWSLLPAYRWLAQIVCALRLQPLLKWGYGYFLRWRSKHICSDNEVCH